MLMKFATQSSLSILVTFIFSPVIFTSAFAETKSATINILATLENACEAGTSQSGNISFGQLNFGLAATIDQDIKITGSANAGAIRIHCNAGTNVKITMGAGNSGNIQSRYMTSGTTADQINYNIFTDTDYTTVWDDTNGVSFTSTGAEQWIATYGIVYGSQNVAAGSYSDAIPVTISW